MPTKVSAKWNPLPPGVSTATGRQPNSSWQIYQYKSNRDIQTQSRWHSGRNAIQFGRILWVQRPKGIFG